MATRRWRSRGWLLLVAAVQCVQCAAGPALTPWINPPMPSTIQQAYDAGNVDGALAMLSQAVQEQPDDTWLRIHLGTIMQERQQFGEAFDTWWDAYETNPNFPLPLIYMANLPQTPADAMDLLRRAVAADQTGEYRMFTLLASSDLAGRLLNSGQLEEAETLLNAIMAQSRPTASDYINLAGVRQHQYRPDECIAALLAALETAKRASVEDGEIVWAEQFANEQMEARKARGDVGTAYHRLAAMYCDAPRSHPLHACTLLTPPPTGTCAPRRRPAPPDEL
jgi:tetratricopeptide (TPR) repeat protein